LISVAKAVLVFGATVVLAAVVAAQRGGPGRLFADAEPAIRARSGGDGSLALAPELTSAYTTLALGSAFALLCYPHVTTSVLAARGARTVRRNAFLLPAWTAVLAVLALLGVAAAARGVAAPAGRAELALPLLVRDVLPDVGAGFVLGILGIGALVPVAVMSVAAANLFTRNVYTEFLNPTATPKLQVRVARTVSVLVKVGALGFVLALRTEDAINLQLLGGVWILQTAPAVIIGLWSGWPHRGAVLAGWAVGMVAGTALLATNGFVSVVPVTVGPLQVQVYAALLALVANLVVVVGLTPVLDRLRVPRGLDTTGTEGLESGRLPQREWLATRSAT
jgi:SSS family solute:Na+ symporter